MLNAGCGMQIPDSAANCYLQLLHRPLEPFQLFEPALNLLHYTTKWV